MRTTMRRSIAALVGLTMAGTGLLTVQAQAFVTTAAGVMVLGFTPTLPASNCQDVSGTFLGEFQATNIDGVSGQFGVTGTICATSASGGTLALAIVGPLPNTFCASLTGTYTQTAAIMQSTVQGACTVQNSNFGTMTFTSVGIVEGAAYVGVTASLQQG